MAKKMVQMPMPGHMHSKAGMIIAGLVAIVIGVWAWMSEPTLVQVVAVLLVLIGIKKLLWTCKCC
ncbi:hypothetical protein J4427_00190 [Candidatus Woesearchaeota archaeon]|nr:hypothetical protein [Candidatus Woesearchaeota archaeon]